MNFLILCTKIEQDFHGVMSIRPPLLVLQTPHLHTSSEAKAAFLTITTHRLPPPPVTTFEEDDRARIAGVNIVVEACDS
jgi:hypothetical protein